MKGSISNGGPMTEEQMTAGLKRYTIYAVWLDDGEEVSGEEVVDVDANDEREARALGEAELKANYEPGAKIKAVKRQTGLYL